MYTSRGFPESDWKLYKPLHKETLRRFCERILAEVSQVIADDSKTAHERYMAVYRLIRERNKEVADMFDGFSRSKAPDHMMLMDAYGLILPEELARFSEGTRQFLAGVRELREENQRSKHHEG